jgi:hypothetical protein
MNEGNNGGWYVTTRAMGWMMDWTPNYGERWLDRIYRSRDDGGGDDY